MVIRQIRRSLVFGCFAALSLLIIPAAALGQTIEEAIKLFDGGDYNRSEEILKQLLDADKKNQLALVYLGKVYAAQGDFERAESQLKKTVKNDKNYARGYYELGKLALMKPRGILNRRNQEARNQFEKALEVDPSFSEAKYALFESYFDTDDPKEAFAYLSDFLRDEPGSVKGYLSMAKLITCYEYNILRRCEQLQQVYEAAYKGNPENPEDYFTIGWGLFLCDDLSGSRMAYIKGELKSRNIHYDTYLDMMAVNFEDLKFGQARQYLEKAFASMPLDQQSALTDVEKVPPYIADELEKKYNVRPEQFANPNYVPENQFVYIGQLYHFATLWIRSKTVIDRLKPIDYSGNKTLGEPYLLHAGVRNYLDYAFQFLLGGQEKQEFLSIPIAHDRTSWRLKWFRRNDPTPTTPENEMEAEFGRRVKYVYEQFKILPNKFHDEWRERDFGGFDDRGKVYLKYGQPGDYYIDLGGQKNQESMTDAASAANRYSYGPFRQIQIKANQSWTYEHLDTFLFFDFVEMNDGYYTLVDHLDEAAYGMNALRLYLNERRGDIGGFYTLAYNQYAEQLRLLDSKDDRFANEATIRNSLQNLGLTQEQIDEYMDRVDATGLDFLLEIVDIDEQAFLTEMLIPELAHKTEVMENYPTDIKDIVKAKKRLPINIDWASFKGADGKAKIEIYTGVDYRNLDFLKEADGKLLTLIEYDVVVKDPDILPVVSDTGLTKLLINRSELKHDKTSIKMFAYDLKPQDYLVVMNGRNPIGKREFNYEIEAPLRDYSGDTLMLSDIQLAFDIVPASERAIFVKNDVSVLPYPYRIINKSKPISIYYEIYNLSKLANGSTSYDITYTVTVTNPNYGLINALKTLFPGRRQKSSLSLQFSKTGRSEDQAEYIGFDLSNLIPGKVELRIRITDRVSRKTALRKIDFNVF